jgi:hypothetical protein
VLEVRKDQEKRPESGGQAQRYTRAQEGAKEFAFDLEIASNWGARAVGMAGETHRRTAAGAAALRSSASLLNCPFGLNRLLTQPLWNFRQLSLVGTDRGQVLQLANQK